MPEREPTMYGEAIRSLSPSSRQNGFEEPSIISTRIKRIFIPGGQTLLRENEVADSIYIVVSGCLGVIAHGSQGRDLLVARIAAGETVGEMALLDDGVRSATGEALRDTELLKFDRASYQDLLVRDPKSMRAVISLLLGRLRKTTHPNDGATWPMRTAAMVPLGLDVDHRSVANVLRDVLSGDGQRTMLLDDISADSPNEVVECGRSPK